MRGASWGVIALAMIVTLLLLGSLLLVQGLATLSGDTGGNGANPSGGGGHGSAGEHGGPSAGAGGPSALPANPANCSQGSQTIAVRPGPGDMHNTLVQDYDALGEDGGGTLLLRPGVFYVNETLDFQKYSNVSIQGSGIKKTTISLPLDPLQHFTNDNGTLVGLFNASRDGPENGPAVNFLQVLGGPALNNFQLCDLSIDAQANNASEDWAGSLIMDAGGGHHHVYSDIAETGFYGPYGNPNGLHIDGYNHPALGYVIDDFYADKDSWPSANHSFYAGGPNFLNTGDVTNCTEQNVTAIGNMEFEVAPSVGCTIENVDVQGHMLIDPLYETSDTGGPPLPPGSWGGTVFQNVTLNVEGTNGPNALDISDTNGSVGTSDFNDLRWNHDHFVGGVFAAENMVDVTNSTFDGGIDALPATFVGNTVTWAPSLFGRDSMILPILVDGMPSANSTGGTISFVSGNTFDFPNGTGIHDPLRLTVPDDISEKNTIKIAGATRGFVMSAADVAITQNSSFDGITYDSLGNGSPAELQLMDVAGSSGFQDLGASVDHLSGVANNLPLYFPSPPTGLVGVARSPTEVNLSWNASTGPVTNYTVWAGPGPGSIEPFYSAGLTTSCVLTGLTPGSKLYFGVEAWNSSFHSGVEGTVELTTPDYAPGVPTGLAVTSLMTDEIGLEWDASTGHVTNYTVYVGTRPSTFAARYSVGAGTEYVVPGLHANTTYYLAVQAWNDSWDSALSSVVNATTLPSTPPRGPNSPGAPTGLVVTSETASQVAIRWTAASGNVTNYTILEGTSASTLVPAISVGLTTTYVVTGLRPNTLYFFAIQAWNGSSSSERSEVVNATTLFGSSPHPISGWLIVITVLIGIPGAIVASLALVGRHRANVRRARDHRSGRRPTAKDRT